MVGLGAVKPGVGRMLMRHALRQASQRGVGLELYSVDSAQDFYRKLGLDKRKPGDLWDTEYEASPEKVKRLVTTV